MPSRAQVSSRESDPGGDRGQVGFGFDSIEGVLHGFGNDLLEDGGLGQIAPGPAALVQVLDAGESGLLAAFQAGDLLFQVMIEVRRGRGAQRLRDRIVQLAQAVEHLLVLVGQPLERPLVILEPVGQHDADDPPLLVPEEVVEPVGLARETRCSAGS